MTRTLSNCMLPVSRKEGGLYYPFEFKNNKENERNLYWGIELNEALQRKATIHTVGYYTWQNNIPFFKNFSE